MVKITYDLNNKSDCKLVNDYYNLKYFLKCLYSDWHKQFDYISFHSFECGRFCDEDYIKFKMMVYKHINKEELNYYLKLIFALDILEDLKTDDSYYITDLFWFKEHIIKDYKKILKNKFGPKKV